MTQLDYTTFDRWLGEEAPDSSVVISSRARLARNLPRQPYSPRANADQLSHIVQSLGAGIAQAPAFSRFEYVPMDGISAEDRAFLRESHLISSELEKGGHHRGVMLGPDRKSSLMVNEEDHVRLGVLEPGLSLDLAYAKIASLEAELERRIDFAYSDEFGYLTACPTNTGTGLRMSVMLHLPGLTLREMTDATLEPLGHYGLVVRGAYGEHSENIGDLYQISNEITLGKSEEELIAILTRVVKQVILRELQARESLRSEKRETLEDLVCRAIGALATARRIDSMEAATLLSRVRLGEGEPWGAGLGDAALSRLFVQVQPAHVKASAPGLDDTADRDRRRAAMLREIFSGNGRSSRN